VIRAAITGIQGWVPEYILTNKELESMVDTNDEWIQSRTGIRERRILKGKDQGTSVMAVNAINGLLQKKGISPWRLTLLSVLLPHPICSFLQQLIL
jgi:3-oxoacyl-[acyl-carrier-protein] synthase-3